MLNFDVFVKYKFKKYDTFKIECHEITFLGFYLKLGFFIPKKENFMFWKHKIGIFKYLDTSKQVRTFGWLCSST